MLLDQLAYAYHSTTKYPEAEECYSRAISITEKNEGAMSPLLVPRLHNLAVLYRIQEKFKEAEQVYKKTILNTEKLDKDSILDLATQKNYLAGLYFAWGKLPDAESLVKDSLKIYTQTLGAAHEYAAFCQMGLSLIYKQQGRDEEANQCFAECERQMKEQPVWNTLESFQDIGSQLVLLVQAAFQTRAP